MINYVKAELLKILKTRFIWILSGAYFLLFISFFYQFTFNEDANVMEILLKDSINLYSFFIIMFTAFFNIIFAVAIGSHIGSKEFSYNTMQNSIQSSGRYNLLIAKIITWLILTVIFVLSIASLGILLGLIHEPIIRMFSMFDFISRLSFGISSTFLLGLFAMTVSTILRSTSKSNVLCLILFLGQNLLPFSRSTKFLYYINPYYYISYYADFMFSNLKGLSHQSFSTINTLTSSQNVLCIFGYFAICLVVQFLIFRKREY